MSTMHAVPEPCIRATQSATATAPVHVQPGPSAKTVARSASWLAIFGFCLTAAPVGLAQESGAVPDATAPNPAARNIQQARPSEAELERMRRFLERTQPDRGVVAQRTLPEGDRVDCVSIEAQPALRSYEMQGH